MPSAPSPYKKVLCSVNTNTYLDNLPDAFPSLRSNLETRNPFYDVHLEWYVDMLLRNQVLKMVGLQYTSTVCVSSRKLRPIVFYSISQYEAFQTNH